MVSLRSGLMVTPNLTQRNVSVTMHFEPSVGILARKVDKLGMDIRSFREPLHRSVREVMAPSIRQNFDSGGRPEPWRELTSATVAHKNGNAKPLIRTGALRRIAGQINIWTIDREKAMVTDLPDKVWYGKVHQAGHGGTKTFQVKNIATGKTETYTEESDEGGGIPARPFIVVQDEDIDRIEQVFDHWLGERMAKAGLR